MPDSNLPIDTAKVLTLDLLYNHLTLPNETQLVIFVGGKPLRYTDITFGSRLTKEDKAQLSGPVNDYCLRINL